MQVKSTIAAAPLQIALSTSSFKSVSHPAGVVGGDTGSKTYLKVVENAFGYNGCIRFRDNYIATELSLPKDSYVMNGFGLLGARSPSGATSIEQGANYNDDATSVNDLFSIFGSLSIHSDSPVEVSLIVGFVYRDTTSTDPLKQSYLYGYHCLPMTTSGSAVKFSQRFIHHCSFSDWIVPYLGYVDATNPTINMNHEICVALRIRNNGSTDAVKLYSVEGDINCHRDDGSTYVYDSSGL